MSLDNLKDIGKIYEDLREQFRQFQARFAAENMKEPVPSLVVSTEQPTEASPCFTFRFLGRQYLVQFDYDVASATADPRASGAVVRVTEHGRSHKQCYLRLAPDGQLTLQATQQVLLNVADPSGSVLTTVLPKIMEPFLPTAP